MCNAIITMPHNSEYHCNCQAYLFSVRISGLFCSQDVSVLTDISFPTPFSPLAFHSVHFICSCHYALYVLTCSTDLSSWHWICLSCAIIVVNIRRILRRLVSGTSTDWLMTWLHRRWSRPVVLCGHAKTMTVMSSLMLWHRVSACQMHNCFK